MHRGFPQVFGPKEPRSGQAHYTTPLDQSTVPRRVVLEAPAGVAFQMAMAKVCKGNIHTSPEVKPEAGSKGSKGLDSRP